MQAVKQPVSIPLDPSVVQQLDDLAAAQQRSRASLMRLFILEGLKAEGEKSTKAESETAPTAA